MDNRVYAQFSLYIKLTSLPINMVSIAPFLYLAVVGDVLGEFCPFLRANNEKLLPPA